MYLYIQQRIYFRQGDRRLLCLNFVQVEFGVPDFRGFKGFVPGDFAAGVGGGATHNAGQGGVCAIGNLDCGICQR